MRWVLGVVPLLTAMLACGGGGGGGGGSSSESSSSGAEESSSTAAVDAFPLVCDPATAIEFPDDEVGLGVISIDALRVVSVDGAVRYDLYIHGDDAELTQIIIRFTGTPQAGLTYSASSSSSAAGPMIELFPGNDSLSLSRGTIKYTTVGTADGELLDLELRLELNTGRLQGCISVPLVAHG
ncbi:MAG: hypothetical protein IAG13_10420 [Deltaproteobacteria bacterium]|nr:hypothetical protein [Nannocystaceae bacterium]